MKIPRPFVLKSPAPAGAHCDVCFSTENVLHGFIWLWWLMNDASAGNRRMCFLCQRCQEPDGGILSMRSINGYVTYITSSRARWPNRVVITTIDVH